ncbi:MAG TPA: DUF1080 domain-containing protein [Candidatus Hydrogenedentes bacterium]|nr:DUF1080 domain-containing protein [Candidatus Hydrogenedentota bacterium]HPG70050.1 DUF1080 domain-containing protein [Candidatus Hydrogenedentota bacterium]
MRYYVCALPVAAACVVACGAATAAENPFLGNWALTIPGGAAGWLGVTHDQGFLDASVLWGGGSVVPVASVYLDGDTLVVTRTRDVERKDAAGNVIRKQTFTETLTATADGDALSLTQMRPNESGVGVIRAEFSGVRIPPVPAAPDLAALKYGQPITLFNGKDLDGWELTDRHAISGWSAQDGILVNDPVQEEGKPRKHYGNLRTKSEFEDFNLTCDVQVPKGGNSGVYLRGIYEVQVVDSYGSPVDPHNMGGIYSRIAPSVAAEKPAGEWQSLDITLADRHVTVKLNGTTIIDNQPLLGCTGGALWSDEFRPGPIYFQGDHTGIKYRNIVLTPIVK